MTSEIAQIGHFDHTSRLPPDLFVLTIATQAYHCLFVHRVADRAGVGRPCGRGIEFGRFLFIRKINCSYTLECKLYHPD